MDTQMEQCDRCGEDSGVVQSLSGQREFKRNHIKTDRELLWIKRKS